MSVDVKKRSTHNYLIISEDFTRWGPLAGQIRPKFLIFQKLFFERSKFLFFVGVEFFLRYSFDAEKPYLSIGGIFRAIGAL